MYEWYSHNNIHLTLLLSPFNTTVPYMQGVVYCTRSMLSNENETVVTRSIDIINTNGSKKVNWNVTKINSVS